MKTFNELLLNLLNKGYRLEIHRDICLEDSMLIHIRFLDKENDRLYQVESLIDMSMQSLLIDDSYLLALESLIEQLDYLIEKDKRPTESYGIAIIDFSNPPKLKRGDDVSYKDNPNPPIKFFKVIDINDQSITLKDSETLQIFEEDINKVQFRIRMYHGEGSRR